MSSTSACGVVLTCGRSLPTRGVRYRRQQSPSSSGWRTRLGRLSEVALQHAPQTCADVSAHRPTSCVRSLIRASPDTQNRLDLLAARCLDVHRREVYPARRLTQDSGITEIVVLEATMAPLRETTPASPRRRAHRAQRAGPPPRCERPLSGSDVFLGRCTSRESLARRSALEAGDESVGAAARAIRRRSPRHPSAHRLDSLCCPGRCSDSAPCVSRLPVSIGDPLSSPNRRVGAAVHPRASHENPRAHKHGSQR